MAQEHTVKAFDEDITRLRGLIAEMGGLAEVSISESMDALVNGNAELAEAVLQRGDADLVALARSFLYKPRWGWEAAVALGGTVDAQHQYWRSLPREAKNIFNNAQIGMR